MKKLYKSSQWVAVQAKTLERKTLNRAGRSLTFSGIERYLLANDVIIEIQGNVYVLDGDTYDKNKENTIKLLLKEYPNKEG